MGFNSGFKGLMFLFHNLIYHFNPLSGCCELYKFSDVQTNRRNLPPLCDERAERKKTWNKVRGISIWF